MSYGEETAERGRSGIDPANQERTPAGRHLKLVTPAPRVETTDGALQSMELGPMELELGGFLSTVTLAYRTWGRLNAARDNAVIVLHALTGDSRAAGDGGWWEPLIGPGRAIDTDGAFVICANILGGCQGSTGPASLDPITGRAYGMRFPVVTVGDMVNAQRRLVERLGITKIIPIGGSIGGFQALDWATRHPDIVRAAAPLAANGALGPQGIALNESGRRAIMADPNWRGGDYASEGVFPADGLAVARMIAMVTFHSRESMDQRFGRRQATRPTLYPAFGGTFDVEGYIHYHGAAIVRRFDANSHLYLTRAMDLYDVARNGGEEYWLRQIEAPVKFLGISSDWLYPPDEIEALAVRAEQAGVNVSYSRIESPHGHDAFLKEWDLMTGAVKPFVEQALAGVARP